METASTSFLCCFRQFEAWESLGKVCLYYYLAGRPQRIIFWMSSHAARLSKNWTAGPYIPESVMRTYLCISLIV